MIKNLFKFTVINLIFYFQLSFSSFAMEKIDVNSAEDLMYTTVRITCFDNENPKNAKEKSIGTGFIYNFYDKNKIMSPYLVTNKHVIKKSIRGEMRFNISANNIDVIDFFDIGVGDNKSPFYKSFINHPFDDDKNDNYIDLCVLPLRNIFNYIENDINLEEENNYINKTKNNKFTPFEYPLKPIKKRVFYRSLSRENLVSVSYASPVQDILMVGYPIGIWDEKNNLPIFRKGITSSHVNKDFQGKPEVLIDAACFPGSSGSPVFITSKGNFYFDKHFKPTLLGILYSGPKNGTNGTVEYDEKGNLLREPILTEICVNVPPHLGFVIQGKVLEDIQKILSK